MPDHVLVTVWENTDYSSLIGNVAQAPYFNGLLSQGLLFTNYHALDHPSEGNYIAMFSGGDQGLTTDTCPQSTGAENVFHLLANASKTYLGYMEDLPSTGFTGCTNLNYVRRHNASIQFTNVSASTSVAWTSFPSDYTTLPNLSVVIPNLQHDLHDGTMAQADAWLQTNLDPYIQWCKTHNSLFVFTIDESSTGGPASQVPLLIIGAGITPNTTNSTSYDHTNLSSTLSGMFSLASLGPAPITGWYTPAALVSDTFQRSNVAASSWGTATDGHIWTIVQQTTGTAQVTSDAGQVSDSNGAGINLLLGSYSRTDAEVLVQTSLSDPTAATHPILRYESFGNFYYAGQDLNNLLVIKTRVGDVGTVLVSTSNTVSANQKFWLRFRIQGSTLSLKFWLDGNSEPAGWSLQTTDTTYAGGAIGYRGTSHSTTDTVSVYSYAAYDLTATTQNQFVADSFTRANQSGFGTGSDGEIWVQKDGLAALSIASNKGEATTFSGSTNVVIGGTADYDTVMTARFSVSVAGSDAFFFIARWTNNTNFYYIGFTSNNLSIRKVVAGSTTTVTSTVNVISSSTSYWLSALVQGTTIKVKIWQDGGSEPTSWGLSTTDSSLTEGNPGFRLFGASSGDVVLVDSLTIVDPSPSLYPLTLGSTGAYVPAQTYQALLTPTFTSTGFLNYYTSTLLSPQQIASLINYVPPVIATGVTMPVYASSTMPVYQVNGIPLQDLPMIMTAPAVMGKLVPAGSTFLLLFSGASGGTQAALANGTQVTLTFAVYGGQMVSGLVSCTSSLSGAMFQVMCTTSVAISVP